MQRDAGGLTPADIAAMRDCGVSAELLERAKVRRITSDEAHRLLDRKGEDNLAGLVYPYFYPGETKPVLERVRLDEPVWRDSKPAKYLSPAGAKNHLYFVPGTQQSLLQDTSVPVSIVEGEKKAISLQGLAESGGVNKVRWLAIAIAGVWNWQKNSIAIDDFDRVKWQGRTVYLIFDSNVNSNLSVAKAREGLTAQLQKRGAHVLWVNVPEEDGVNGIDDFIGKHGPEKALGVIQAANRAPIQPKLDLGICTFDLNRETEPPIIYYRGFLSRADLAVWIGREKHRKSTIALILILSAAVGRSFLNCTFMAPQPLRVTIIDYETKQFSLRNRTLRIMDALGFTDEERELVKQNVKFLLLRELSSTGDYMPMFPVLGSGKSNREEEKALQAWKDIVEKYPADIYMIDPMRCMHNGDENDSKVANLLASIRVVFKNETVLILHHMKKPDRRKPPKLKNDMRDWSNDVRGSTAIKAQADVIVCQEQVIDDRGEVIWFGCFSKDNADFGPIGLVESSPESFNFTPIATVPSRCMGALRLLAGAGTKFPSRKAAVDFLVSKGHKDSTAYRHIGDLIGCGALSVDKEGCLTVRPGGDDENPRKAA